MVIVDRGLEGIDADLVRIDHELRRLSGHPAPAGVGASATSPAISGPGRTPAWRSMRLAGYHRALQEAGIEVPDSCDRWKATSPAPVAITLQASLLENDPPTRDLCRQRHDGYRCFACGGRAQRACAGRAVGHRFRRYPDESLRVPGADHRRAVDPAAGRDGRRSLARADCDPTGDRCNAIVTPSIVLRESTAPPTNAFTISMSRALNPN